MRHLHISLAVFTTLLAVLLIASLSVNYLFYTGFLWVDHEARIKNEQVLSAFEGREQPVHPTPVQIRKGR